MVLAFCTGFFRLRLPGQALDGMLLVYRVLIGCFLNFRHIKLILRCLLENEILPFKNLLPFSLYPHVYHTFPLHPGIETTKHSVVPDQGPPSGRGQQPAVQGGEAG